MPYHYLGLWLAPILIGTVVLAFVLEIREFLHTPVPADGEETEDQKRDRRVFRRIRAVGGAAAFLFVAGVIAMDLVYPRLSNLAEILVHPYSLVIYGVAFFVVALLCGAKPRQPVLLVCLTLPGLVVMPLAVLADMAVSPLLVVAPFFLLFAFLVQPGLWILLCIGIGQARLLRQPAGNYTASGLARIILVLCGYVFGMFH
jgi:hypothetical protein